MNFKLYILSIVLTLLCFTMEGSAQKRIISLAPSITKSIVLLDGSKQLVGCTTYCEEAKEDNSNVVGNAISINLEKILLLKPDLVLATTLTKAEDIKKLEQFGIKTHQFSRVESFQNMCEQLIELGEKINKSKKALSIVETSKQQLSVLQKRVKQRNTTPSIFIEIGAKPLFAAIPKTFVHDFIILAGATNIAADIQHGTITREGVITRNPDIIFLVTMGTVGVEEQKIWSSYTTMSAAKYNRIFILEQNEVCSPTVPVFVQTLEKMLDLISNK